MLVDVEGGGDDGAHPARRKPFLEILPGACHHAVVSRHPAADGRAQDAVLQLQILQSKRLENISWREGLRAHGGGPTAVAGTVEARCGSFSRLSASSKSAVAKPSVKRAYT